jgi:O-antigen/teichoic acid export membrane protein
VVVFGFMMWVGVPIMSFLYGVDFEPMRGLMYVMLVAGGVTAAIDFLYQVITVMRRQKDVTTLYFVTFAFSLFVPILLVMFTGLPGAVLSYLIIMVLLFVLLVWEYLRIRRDLAEAAKIARREAALSHVPGH